jgi:hypothetical protein
MGDTIQDLQLSTEQPGVGSIQVHDRIAKPSVPSILKSIGTGVHKPSEFLFVLMGHFWENAETAQESKPSASEIGWSLVFPSSKVRQIEEQVSGCLEHASQQRLTDHRDSEYEGVDPADQV